MHCGAFRHCVWDSSETSNFECWHVQFTNSQGGMNHGFTFGEYGQSNVHIAQREDRCSDHGSTFVDIRGEPQLSVQVGQKEHKNTLQ